ncbi:Holliday junction resolvase RuvX [Candidatus Enterovibrio escicola]|uniref:Putative pre-16S rRNA nuclease n=1 Tax=Candidatus Enterovibrio escicola TaxID=1927127 RepID=A0A2A5T1W6_9GAMM|nr:Holliday junction resolvase RuvX [Candidatus Enterovibrio escacola]PCS22144.1 putative Holliday junction resolvase YqgF [Candidatus Enterovibrio escacola]
MNNIQSVMGFDYGTKSIGVAIGQVITCTAHSLKALKAKDGIPSWDTIEAVLREWEPDLIVVGLPLDLQGQELTIITLRVRKFAHRLEGRFGINVELHDERFTTVSARSSLFESGGYRALRKSKIDSQSAVIIVESWLGNQCS